MHLSFSFNQYLLLYLSICFVVKGSCYSSSIFLMDVKYLGMHLSMELPCNRWYRNRGVNRLLQKKTEYIIIFRLRISICSGLPMHNKCFNSSGSMPSGCFCKSWIIILYFPKSLLWLKIWEFLWVWLNLKGTTTSCYLRYFQVSILTEWDNSKGKKNICPKQ